ncbi:DUF6705 family protein [Chryseobacterium sp. CT-SW4]|uniref:DUF6705 family protein n=1 Tax=Chryseobacterium sp. SW-1 TaxID=3157343 RepID=UPI003B01C447
MKKILALLLINIITIINAQTYPLRTYGIDFPKDSYVKDTNNELVNYEGAWKGQWNNKNFEINFIKIKKCINHIETRPYYKDIIIGKFKVTDQNNSVLFDNTSLLNDNAKIEGGGFKKTDGKYSLTYSDPDICYMWGIITINFTDSNKNKLHWNFSDMTDMLTPDCPYLNTIFPEPLPKDIVLTKQ